MRTSFGSVATGLAVLFAVVAATGVWRPAGATEPLLRPEDPATIQMGQAVYAAECAACHGEALEGQPDWQIMGADGLRPAPPHDVSGHTWHHDDATLFALTKYSLAGVLGAGAPTTGMPAFEGVLSDAEIVAVLSYIKSTWPAEIKARHDQINARAAGQ